MNDESLASLSKSSTKVFGKCTAELTLRRQLFFSCLFFIAINVSLSNPYNLTFSVRHFKRKMLSLFEMNSLKVPQKACNL